MNSMNETMFLCERVMAELCSDFDDMFGGEWDYEPDAAAGTFDLTRGGTKVGATMTAETVHSLVEQGIDEVQLYKMYVSAWSKLLPEAHSDMRRIV